MVFFFLQERLFLLCMMLFQIKYLFWSYLQASEHCLVFHKYSAHICKQVARDEYIFLPVASTSCCFCFSPTFFLLPFHLAKRLTSNCCSLDFLIDSLILLHLLNPVLIEQTLLINFFEGNIL